MGIVANIFRRYQPDCSTLVTLSSPEAPTKFKSNASCQGSGRIWPLLFLINRLSNSQFQSLIPSVDGSSGRRDENAVFHWLQVTQMDTSNWHVIALHCFLGLA